MFCKGDNEKYEKYEIMRAIILSWHLYFAFLIRILCHYDPRRITFSIREKFLRKMSNG